MNPSHASSSHQSDELNTIKNLCQEAQKVLLNSTKTANSFPLDEYDYFNSFREFTNLMEKNRKNIASMIDSLTQRHLGKEKPFSRAVDDVERFQVIIDANDCLLDRVCNSFDEVEGLKKKNEELIVATIKQSNFDSKTGKGRVNAGKDVTLVTAKMVERPQVHFADKIDNSHNPFIPRITEKPNSIKPLSLLPEELDDGVITYSHPYELEIEQFEPSMKRELQLKQPQPPSSMEETPFTYVDTVESLEGMMSHLKTVDEIAVDLEHHSFRTFQGFTCLMQISTRSQDFVIDTLKLRSKLTCLNEVFTDARVVKVFHGADHDIIWLQRDFAVYVVNLFDTFQASKVIGSAHHSLAHLLKSYCHVECDKKYQLADWRVRPLSDEMLLYARSDTHYLLYLYDLMKKHLIEKDQQSVNLLKSVFARSSQVCLKKYEKTRLTSTSYLSLITRNGIALNSRQKYALEKLYEWRDKVARVEDESYGFVLPNHMLLQLCQLLPREMQGILAACNPTPPLVKQNLNELHQIILRAREQLLTKSTDKRKSIGSIMPKISDYFCKHDVQMSEFEFHPLLDSSSASSSTTHTSSDVIKPPVFMKSKDKQSKLMQFMQYKGSARKRSNITSNLISPFDRYTHAVASKDADETKKKKKRENDEST